MEVQFKNFRCFKDTGRVPIKPITLLVGENSSGKTSFMAGLNHVYGLLQDESTDLNTEPFGLGAFGDVVYRESGKNRRKGTIEYKFYSENDDIVRWTFRNSNGDMKLDGSSIETKGKDFIDIKKENFEVRFALERSQIALLQDLGFNVRKVQNENVHKIQLPDSYKSISMRSLRMRRAGYNICGSYFAISHYFESYFYNLDDDDKKNKKFFRKQPNSVGAVRNRIAQSQDSTEALWLKFTRRPREIVRNITQNLGNVVSLAPLRNKPERAYFYGRGDLSVADPSGENVPAKIMKLASEEKDAWSVFNETLTSFGRNAGLFENLEVKSLTSSTYPFEVNVVIDGKRASNICDVGYGVSQILPLLFEIIYSRRNTTFLIQQPEVHLHPRAQAEFGSLIVQLSKLGKKFIVETHSDFILDRLTYEISKNKFSNENVGILFFDRLEDQSCIHPINLGKDGTPVEVPKSYRKFFLDEVKRVWR